MPRIAGVTIPTEKRIEISLTYIYGIGLTKSRALLGKAGIDPNTRANKLTEDELDKLRALIEKQEKVEGDLRREIGANIKRLKDIGSYIGSRHSKGLPVHGQQTKTNARTRKGKKVTVGSGRKPAASKT
ncbi:30S ribosomal protein S13 [Patescibacteria group bacterium]|nr:30S ribosomal protein S13 [Patescibacteria group bacterium]